MFEQRIIDTKTTLMIKWKQQFVNSHQNVWHKIVILTDISNRYQSFRSIIQPFTQERTTFEPETLTFSIKSK